MAQTVNGVTTRYALDGSAGLTAGVTGGPSTALRTGLPEVIAAAGSGASTQYLQVQGQILAQVDSGTWGYVAPDALGSVRQLVAPAGAVTLAQSYNPWGNVLEVAGAGQSGFGYTGEQTDVSTGLVFLRARWYAPEIGIFLSRDPVEGEPFYLYARGNPIRWTDPSGRSPDAGSCLLCGPDVTDWFAVELKYWRDKTRREMFPFELGACRTGKSEIVKGAAVGMNLKYGKAFPYKVIDFNYADAPNREGHSPWPPMASMYGRLHGARYEQALNGEFPVYEGNRVVPPNEITWLVPGGGSVTLCHTCIERSELGNFMLGYFAFFTHLTEEEIATAAILVGGSQRTWDEAALRFGHRYADSGRSAPCCRDDPQRAASTSLCSFLFQAGIGAMVDAYVRSFAPSFHKLHSGFGHYTQPEQWDITWGPVPRMVDDVNANPVTTGPRIRNNNPLRNCQLEPYSCLVPWFPHVKTRPIRRWPEWTP